ncbi:MAG: sigma-54 dependent transcriptional regulator [Fibrobacterales bacterium]
MVKISEKVLIIDDEKSFINSASIAMEFAGFSNVSSLSDSKAVPNYLNENDTDIILLDLSMPGLSGVELLKQIIHEHPDILVIIISANTETDMIIECMKLGAKDYMIKPLDNKRLITTLKNSSKVIALKNENQTIRKKLIEGTVDKPDVFKELVTQSNKMQSIFSYAEMVAVSPLPVMINGETGTGKELMAQALHSLRSPKEIFVCCNVAGIDDAAFSDTLFGHKKGAFTGADTVRAGLIEKANGGTLFLDEIGDLSAESQVKLLRLIQEGEYFPIGSDVPKKSNAWIIVATHCALEDKPGFRKDLYFRLKAHRIKLPAMRDRLEDIPLLVHHFINKYLNGEEVEGGEMFSRNLIRHLTNHPLAGNVRELEGIVADAVLSGSLAVVSHEIDMSAGENIEDEFIFKCDGFPTMDEIKKTVIRMAVHKCNGNKVDAAKLLGVSNQTVYSCWKQLNL